MNCVLKTLVVMVGGGGGGCGGGGGGCGGGGGGYWMTTLRHVCLQRHMRQSNKTGPGLNLNLS